MSDENEQTPATDPYAGLKALAEQIRGLDRTELMLLSGMLLAEIAGEKVEQLTRDELRRRAEALAATARESSAGYGRLACPVCAGPKQAHAMLGHIMRQHPDQAAAFLPPKGPRHAG